VQDLFSGKWLRTRGGALIAGGIAAVLAAILLIVYLQSYRHSVNSNKRPVQVLVAKVVIRAGTTGDTVGRKGMYQLANVPKDDLKPEAISDPAALRGRVAATDIFAGQQITQADFTTENTTGLAYQLTGNQRAIAIPVDSAHGLVGEVVSGNHVDVYVGLQGPVVTLLAPDVDVLVAPGSGGGGGNAILRVTEAQAAKFALAADNAKMWFVLRPQTGSSKTSPQYATIADLSALARGAGKVK